MKRPKQLAVAAVVLVLALSLAWWLFGRAPMGFVTAIAPLDGERAIFTMRHNPSQGRSQAWIGMVDVDGVVWSRELPDLTYSIHARHGLTVTEDRVTVKVSDGDTYGQLLAFSTTTGDPLWQGQRTAFQASEFPGMLYVADGTHPFDDDVQLLHGDHDRKIAHLVALDARDGKTQWSYELPAHGVQTMLVAPRAVALRIDATWVFVRRSDGTLTRTLAEYAAACIDDERFVTWGRQALIEVDLTRDDLPAIERPLVSPGIPLRCGKHGGQFVFTVAVGGEAQKFQLIGVDRDPAAVAWHLDLGPWEPFSSARERDNVGPEADPLSGLLSDFVPLLLTTHGDDGLKIAVIDQTKHALAWESPIHAELLRDQLFRGSGNQYFLTNGQRIAAIDGATGELTAAVELSHDDPRAFHAIDGRLWVHTMEYARMNALPWLVLDGRTLEVLARGSGQDEPADVLAELHAWLR